MIGASYTMCFRPSVDDTQRTRTRSKRARDAHRGADAVNSLFRRALHWKRPQRRSPTSIDESGAADDRGSGERCAVLQAACHELRQRNCCRGRHELSRRQTIDLFLRVLTRPPTEESVHARGRASNSGRKSEQQRHRWRHRKQRKQRKQHPWQQPIQQKMTYASAENDVCPSATHEEVQVFCT